MTHNTIDADKAVKELYAGLLNLYEFSKIEDDENYWAAGNAAKLIERYASAVQGSSDD